MIRRIITALTVLLILVLVAVAALLYFYTGMLEPVNPEAVGEYEIVEIPSGAATETIAELLYEKGLIKNELIFRIYVRQRKLGLKLIAGVYSFSPAMSLNEIAKKISTGDVYSETNWFTIPEGYTVEEMAARLEEKGLVDSEKFLELARNPSEEIIAKFTFLQDINNQGIYYLLEGYLFPDTYEVYSNVGEEEIILTMLRKMNQVVYETYAQRIEESDLSLHEILTIASLVEREAAVDHERSRIAGVIFNRLAIGQRLEIDATIQYALGETKEFLLYADLEIDSPYNTYRNDGLPPGPIAAPGEASIKAALYPEKTDFFFYNYKYDGSGEHFFSHTFQEHLENVRRAEANLP